MFYLQNLQSGTMYVQETWVVYKLLKVHSTYNNSLHNDTFKEVD